MSHRRKEKHGKRVGRSCEKTKTREERIGYQTTHLKWKCCRER
jgi:hypothetical protein